MEWLTIILSSLLTIIAPSGLIIDTVAANQIRSRVDKVDQLAVRIDNVPSYQALGGKVDRIRIASRGIYLIPQLRIEELELESDPFDVNIQKLQQIGKNSLSESLRKPAQVALRFVIKSNDINQALESEEIKSRLQKILNNLVPKQDDLQIKFELTSGKLEFLPNNRVRTQIQLKQFRAEENTPQNLDIVLEAEIKVTSGRTVSIIGPTGSINGRKLSTRLLNGFADGLTKRLDLRNLEKQGVIVRVLQFNVEKESLNVAAFIRVNPTQPGTQDKSK